MGTLRLAGRKAFRRDIGLSGTGISVVLAILLLGLSTAHARAARSCRVTPGSRELLIHATVLTPAGAIDDGEVLVGSDGRIACVGLSCRSRAPGATMLDCPDDVLSPGLINTHDHIDYTGIAPRPDTGERYEHRHEWRKGLDGHRRLENFQPDRDPRVIAWGELRFLVGGATSTVGEAMAPGLLRNLDFAAGLEGLPVRPVTYRIFPLDDADGIMRTRDCDYGHHPATHDEVAASSAFLAHVAEGRDQAARNEFRCESDAGYDRTPEPGGGGTANDWIMPQAALIHAVALTTSDLALVAQRRASIVWSPRSNLALYGKTLDVLEAHRLGIAVALGSDWLPSGSMNLNRELACAVSYDQTHLGGALSDRDLWRMVTIDAARVVHDEAQVGSIAPGQAADLALFERQGADPYAAVVSSTPRSVALVMRGGTILYGIPTVVDALRPGCGALDVAGAAKLLCPEPDRLDAGALQAFARSRNLYPIAFAGPPLNEPTCAASP